MKKLISATLVSLTIFLTPSANAQSLGEVVQHIDLLRAEIASYVKTTMDTVFKLMYEPNPSLPATKVGNLGLANGQPAAINTAQAISLEETRKSLVTKTDDQTARLAGIVASDTYLPTQGVLAKFTGRQTTFNPLIGNSNFNLDSLLAPSVYYNYDFKQMNNNPAYNFVQAVGGLYQSPTTLAISGLTEQQMLDLQASPNYQRYQAAVRAYVAAQSVGASNLYQLMAERIPQQGLGTAAGLVDKAGRPVPNASDLQVQEYLATRRSQNAQWYDAMASASPATVQRETLFVLAEIRQQLFELQKQNERLIATMSVMELQNAQTSKLNLQQLEQPVDAQVKKLKGIENTMPELNIPGISGQ